MSLEESNFPVYTIFDAGDFSRHHRAGTDNDEIPNYIVREERSKRRKTTEAFRAHFFNDPTR